MKLPYFNDQLLNFVNTKVIFKKEKTIKIIKKKKRKTNYKEYFEADLRSVYWESTMCIVLYITG